MTHVQATAPLGRSVDPPADPAGWLPEPHRRSGADQWTISMPMGPWRHDAKVRLGNVWRDESAVGRPISWQVVPRDHDALPYERLFPPVSGEVIVADEHVEIRASYEPPGGLAGRAVDLVGRRLAQRAVRQLASVVAASLAARAHDPQES